MATIPHALVTGLANFSYTSSTFQIPPGAVLASSNFVAGRKYLIIATAQMLGGTSQNLGARMRHGGNVFPTSEFFVEPADGDDRYAYKWFHLWTAVDSEDIDMQVNEQGDGTAEIDQLQIVVIELSECFQEGTDFLYDINETNTNIPVGSFTSTNNASVTFTPANAGDDWLVIGIQQLDPADTSTEQLTRMERSGEASSLTPDTAQEGEDTGEDIMQHMIARVFNLGAVSNTFAMTASRESGGSPGVRLSSTIIAIRLNKFLNFGASYVDGIITTDTTNDFATSTEIATVDMTPSGQDDVWTFSAFVKRNFGSSGMQIRTQFDDVDLPPTQTSDAYDQLDGWDTDGDKLPWVMSSIEETPPDATLHSLDMDATSSSATDCAMRTMVQAELNCELIQDNEFTVDANILATQDDVSTVDAIILLISDNEFTVDACVGLEVDFDFTVDAIIVDRNTHVFTVDALLETPNINEVFNVDAFIEASPFKFFNVDGITLATVDEDFTVDAIVVNRNDDTSLVDSILIERNTDLFTVDARIQMTQFNIILFDAILFATTNNDFTVDAFLESLGVNGTCGDPPF